MLGVSKAHGQIHVVRDEATTLKINETGQYPRMQLLKDGTFICVYEDNKGNCCLNRYNNEWELQKKDIVFTSKKITNGDKVGVTGPANPELLQLKSGRVLYACNYRSSIDGLAPYSIAIKYSDDNCNTWSEINYLYRADDMLKNGCWEPKILELPTGEIQIYFSDENQFRNTNEQEIVMISSFDNGLNWSRPRQVCYSVGKRDGMAVPIIVGNNILMAIEDNTFGKHQPSILTSSIKNNWRKPIMSDSRQRYFAGKDMFDNTVYGGAPYLTASENGDIFLSFQTTYKRNPDLKYASMGVAIKPHNSSMFYFDSFPYVLDERQSGLWNSLYIIDSDHVVALSSITKEGVQAPYLIIGRIVKR